MKVTKVNAFKADDGTIWENEEEAITRNITDVIDCINHNCERSETDLHDDVRQWFRNYPKEIRYILTNIDKINTI